MVNITHLSNSSMHVAWDQEKGLLYIRINYEQTEYITTNRKSMDCLIKAEQLMDPYILRYSEYGIRNLIALVFEDLLNQPIQNKLKGE
jgi:hypothetical protein